MALASALAGILKPDALANRPAGSDALELREVQAGMRVQVVGLPAVVTAIHMDRVAHSPRLAAGGSGECTQICDYLLIVESGDNTLAVFVELKKTATREDKPREQLRRSLPLLEYLRAVCEVEHRTTLNGSRIARRYCIVFERKSRRLSKQPVRVDPARRAQDERYKDINVRTLVGTTVSLAALVGT